MDNDIGVVGVAPGARLWAVQVCKPGGICFRSDIIAGIDYGTANADQIAVANMSIGGSGSDDGSCGLENNDPEHEAICTAVAAGVVFVVSAGNESDDAKNYVPAAYDEVITVSALADFDGLAGGAGAPTCRNDEDDSFANFSNFGADVDLMAPGVCILSTWNDGSINTISGTSMAAPHVTGTVALYVAANDRDTDGDGDIDQTDVDNIKVALTSAGIAQNEACGLSTFDDPDGIAEPIVFANALNVDGDGTCETSDPNDAPTVSITSPADGSTFDSGATILFEGTASDTDDGDLTADLVWTSDIDGPIGTEGSFSTTLSDGNHTITASVTDSGGKTGSASVGITVGTPPAEATTVSVDSITYATEGGKNKYKHLLITVALVDDLGNQVSGASVSIDLFRDGSLVGSGTGTTGTDGTVTFTLKNAASGCYTTTVTDVTAAGLTWDGVTPANEFCK